MNRIMKVVFCLIGLLLYSLAHSQQDVRIFAKLADKLNSKLLYSWCKNVNYEIHKHNW